MLPIERRKQILTWLEEVESLRVADISERLMVSEMTVYRDIAILVKDQSVLKTSNGISLIENTPDVSQGCAYCTKTIHNRLAVQFILTNQEIEQTCCMHCGLLRFNEIEARVSQVICRDFLKDTTLSAKRAIFLLESQLQMNCCQPEILAFASREQAQQFQKGFGGQLMTFHEASIAIEKAMNEQVCHHTE